jgi:hypothetical protein
MWAKEAALLRICLRRWVQAQEAALLQPAAVDVGEGGFAVACCGGLQQLVLPSYLLIVDLAHKHTNKINYQLKFRVLKKVKGAPTGRPAGETKPRAPRATYTLRDLEALAALASS